MHFLRQISFKGYGKWVLLNKAVKEEHPEGYDLEKIIDNQVKDGQTPKGGKDEIFAGLQTHYADKFMKLSKQESNSLLNKMLEFKAVQKQAVIMTFIFSNIMNMKQIKNVFNLYFKYKRFSEDLRNKFQHNYQRINDFENISFEIIQMLVLNLIINTYLKYKSSKEEKRKDAQNSA